MFNPSNPTRTLYLIRCTIGHETYGLDMSWVRSIQRIDRLLITSGEETNETGFIGWLPSNEGDIPVYHMAGRLGQPYSGSTDNDQQRIIVLPSPAPFTNGPREKGQPWGLLVDSVSRVIQTSTDNFSLMPPLAIDPTTNYFEGVIRHNESLILFLSPEWLHPHASSPLGMAQTHQEMGQSAKNPVTLQPKNGQKRHANSSVRPQSVKTKSGQLMVFSTTMPQPGERALSFGLSITQVPELLRPLPLVPVPTAPSFILGLVNWRNYPVPVIDLDTRLGLTPSPSQPLNEQTRLMIVRGVGQNKFVSFPIQPGIRALQLPVAHQPSSRTLSLEPGLTHGMVELAQETLVIPNITRLLQTNGN